MSDRIEIRCGVCGVVSHKAKVGETCPLCELEIKDRPLSESTYHLDLGRLDLSDYLNYWAKGFDFKNDLAALGRVVPWFGARFMKKPFRKPILAYPELRFKITNLERSAPGLVGLLKKSDEELKARSFQVVYERINFSYIPARFERLYVNLGERLIAIASIDGETRRARHSLEATRVGSTVAVATDDRDDIYAWTGADGDVIIAPGASIEELIKAIRNRVRQIERKKAAFTLAEYAKMAASSFAARAQLGVDNELLKVSRSGESRKGTVASSTSLAPSRAEPRAEPREKPRAESGSTPPQPAASERVDVDEPEPLPEESPPPQTAASERESAEAMFRFGLFLFESSIVGLALYFIEPTRFFVDPASRLRILTAALSGASLIALYHFVTSAFFGATLLQRAFGAKIERDDGSTAPISAHLARSVYLLASMTLIVPALGYLLIFFDKRGRTLPDKLTSTQVTVFNRKLKGYFGLAFIMVVVAFLSFNQERLAEALYRLFSARGGSATGALISFDEIWGAVTLGAPIALGDDVIYQSADGIASFNVAKRALNWKRSPASPGRLESGAASGLFFSVKDDPLVETRSIAIQRIDDGSFLLTRRAILPPDGLEGSTIVAYDSGYIYADGAIARSFSLDGANRWDREFDFPIGSMIEMEDQLFLTSQDRSTTAIVSAMTGDQIGRIESGYLPKYQVSTGSALLEKISGGRVDGVALYSLLNNSIIWERRGLAPTERLGARRFVEDSRDRRLYLLDRVVRLDDGADIYIYPSGCSFMERSGRILALSCNDTTLAILDADTGRVTLDTFPLSGVTRIEDISLADASSMELAVLAAPTQTRRDVNLRALRFVHLSTDGTLTDIKSVGFFRAPPEIERLSAKDYLIATSSSVGIYRERK